MSSRANQLMVVVKPDDSHQQRSANTASASRQQNSNVESDAEEPRTTPRNKQSPPSTQPVAKVAPVLNTATLYVGNLPPQVAEVHLHKLFQLWGAEVRRIHQCKHPTTGQPRGFSFVELDSIPSAQTAMEKLDGSTLLGRKLTVRPACSSHRSKVQEVSSFSSSLGATSTTSTNTDLRREKNSLESKIEAVKKVLAEKQKKKT